MKGTGVEVIEKAMPVAAPGAGAVAGDAGGADDSDTRRMDIVYADNDA
jgi:hypothetical protein